MRRMKSFSLSGSALFSTFKLGVISTHLAILNGEQALAARQDNACVGLSRRTAIQSQRLKKTLAEIFLTERQYLGSEGEKRAGTN